MRIVLLAALVAWAGQAYDPFAEARRAEVNGTTLAYVERGTGGTPVVFVHGSGADLRTWGYQLQHFSQSRRTLVYSRRFHHPNPPPTPSDTYTPGQHAADLAAMIGTLAGGRADVVASSYGAVIALLTARDHGARIGRLVVVEPVIFSMLPATSAGASAPAAFERARAQLLAGEAEASMRTFLAALLAPGAYDMMPETTRAMLRDNLPELTAEARAPLPGTSPRYTCEDARAVRVPTLLLDGAQSAVFLRDITRELASCLPGVERGTITGAAHALHAQQVQAFNGAVTAFLDR